MIDHCGTCGYTIDDSFVYKLCYQARDPLVQIRATAHDCNHLTALLLGLYYELGSTLQAGLSLWRQPIIHTLNDFSMNGHDADIPNETL